MNPVPLPAINPLDPGPLGGRNPVPGNLLNFVKAGYVSPSSEVPNGIPFFFYGAYTEELMSLRPPCGF